MFRGRKYATEFRNQWVSLANVLNNDCFFLNTLLKYLIINAALMHGMSQLLSVSLTISLSEYSKLKPFLFNGMAILFDVDEAFFLFCRKSEESNSCQ